VTPQDVDQLAASITAQGRNYRLLRENNQQLAIIIARYAIGDITFE
jgi:hypothetical protein